MQIDNLHLITLLVFIILTGGSSILLWRNYIIREKLKQNYRLLFTQNKLFYIRYICLVISLIIMSIGIFKINYFDSSTITHNEGLDIVFVLDVSKSMNTIDIQNNSYSRLEYAKAQIRSYLSSHPENKYALVIFAGDGISVSPLSNNLDHFLTNLSRLSYTNIGKQGTNLSEALELGYTRFGISQGNTGKALIFISDGGDPDDTLDNNILSEINSENISSFIFGIGSKAEGPIPIGRDAFGETVFQTYQGQIVQTRLNAKLLEDLANSIGGTYNNLEDFGNQLDTIETKALEKSQDKYKQDITGILAIPGSVFFILYLLFPYLIRGRK